MVNKLYRARLEESVVEANGCSLWVLYIDILYSKVQNIEGDKNSKVRGKEENQIIMIDEFEKFSISG